MTLRDIMQSIFQLAGDKVASANGELPQSMYEQVARLLSQDTIVAELSKGIGVDCSAFLRDVGVATGALRGFHSRLHKEMQREAAGEPLSQTAVFALVDLHGRIIGIEGMVFQIADLIAAARTERLGESSLKGRMGTVLVMLEETLAQIVSELGRRAALQHIAPALDQLSAMIRLKRQGEYGTMLTDHINELPA